MLKAGGYSVGFYGWNEADQFFAAWKAAGFRPAGHLGWVKSYASSRGVPAYQHEQAYLLAKGRADRPQRPLPDVLRWQYTGNTLHPTQKPVRSLNLALDPFAVRWRPNFGPPHGQRRAAPARPLLPLPEDGESLVIARNADVGVTQDLVDATDEIFRKKRLCHEMRVSDPRR